MPETTSTRVEIRWSDACLAYVFVEPDAPPDAKSILDRCSHSLPEVLAAARRMGLTVVRVTQRPVAGIEPGIREAITAALLTLECHGPAGIEAFERVTAAAVRRARTRWAEILGPDIDVR